MPIRFLCSNCHQRLSVTTRKAGQEVKCPICRRAVRVPERESAANDADAASETPQPPTMFPEVVADRELIYADPSPEAHRENARLERVLVPRYVLYSQGFLLGAVALVFFVFGLMVGGRSALNRSDAAAVSCVVTGSVGYSAADQVRPDEGSIVLLLPVTRRPDEKIAAHDLVPGTDPLAEDHPAKAVLHSLGGDYARVDRHGKYRVRSGTAGRFVLLIVSSHSVRADDDHPTANQLAQLGRYVSPPTEMLDRHRYHWTELLLRDDQQVDVTF